ncbi:MAG: ABC transporter ATP-binding protein [Pseudomonadota bacterium]|nr:ABC transporter ATP-binding protein [Pseudomonadota bacterium]MED5390852.1 ABC transporter ATP-binding protein [Pseudomonadota bacterium]MEE3282528.1 ABC transporter ATP-binding protein [Pseudomonadota bacterium]MEE3294354.1 ABC transporter ATP-binding protein [Pseudomonadota bacterium]|tara:strand:+ start:814 stop:1587 length:774 start_codon:yes stop_codon:yes gene_type:complete
MTSPLLRVRNIETYYGPITAIRGISLDVEENHIVAVLGANGAGKTTILRTISGIMDPQKGSVTFDGQAIQKREPADIVSRGISHVPEGREIFPLLTVKENLMMGCFLRRDRAKIARDLELVYNYFPVIEQRASQQAGQLSGGEQQMLAISRALMQQPRLLLLDEPSLGLSPRLVKEIFDIVRRLNEERRITILIVEQNANMALRVAHYGYVLEVGRIVMEDSSERLRGNKDIREFYLGIREEGVRGTRRWKRKKVWR